MTKKTFFYHVYMTESPQTWIDIVEEQLKILEASDTIPEIDAMYVTAIAHNYEDDYVLIQDVLRSYGIKNLDIELLDNPFKTDIAMLQALNRNNPRLITEKYTLGKLYNYSKTITSAKQAEENICYFHTKGITSFKYLFPPGADFERYKIYKSWRQHLNGVLANSARAEEHLKIYDTAGSFLTEMPSLHYSGNFWWARSGYIAKLPSPDDMNWWRKIKSNTTDNWLKTCPDRFADEMWLCSSSDKGNHSQLLDVSQGVIPSVHYIRSQTC